MFHDASEEGSINGLARKHIHTYIHTYTAAAVRWSVSGSWSKSKARGMEKKSRGCSAPRAVETLVRKLVDPDLRLRFGPFDSCQLRAGNPARPPLDVRVSSGIPSPTLWWVGEAQTRKTPKPVCIWLDKCHFVRSSVGRHTGGITMTFLTCYE